MLRISQSDYDLIRKEAERSYPQECCGIIVGTDSGEVRRTATLVLPCQNSRADSRDCRYQISPEEIVAALHQARARQESIIGFYHSHPDYPAAYSRTDLEEAFWFGCSYVITGVEKGKAAQTESFLLVGSEEQKGFHAEKLEIV
jgi:proteasome lid subunit RPN8/RPN11